MLCHIYRSNLKLDTYLYLLDKDDFSIVPQELLRVFGPPEFSFSFDLTGEESSPRKMLPRCSRTSRKTVITCNCRMTSWSNRCSR